MRMFLSDKCGAASMLTQKEKQLRFPNALPVGVTRLGESP
jgi:hypothetical protein